MKTLGNISIMLLLLSLFGCAATREAPEKAAERMAKQEAYQQKKSAFRSNLQDGKPKAEFDNIALADTMMQGAEGSVCAQYQFMGMALIFQNGKLSTWSGAQTEMGYYDPNFCPKYLRQSGLSRAVRPGASGSDITIRKGE